MTKNRIYLNYVGVPAALICVGGVTAGIIQSQSKLDPIRDQQAMELEKIQSESTKRLERIKADGQEMKELIRQGITPFDTCTIATYKDSATPPRREDWTSCGASDGSRVIVYDYEVQTRGRGICLGYVEGLPPDRKFHTVRDFSSTGIPELVHTPDACSPENLASPRRDSSSQAPWEKLDQYRDKLNESKPSEGNSQKI